MAHHSISDSELDRSDLDNSEVIEALLSDFLGSTIESKSTTRKKLVGNSLRLIIAAAEMKVLGD